MSDVGLYSSDIQRLRTLGELVDTVLVGADGERSEEFRKACHDLAEALDAATTRPAGSLRSLYLSELLQAYRESAHVAWGSVVSDLTQCSLSSQSRQGLEALARLLEVERARTADRIQSMR